MSLTLDFAPWLDAAARSSAGVRGARLENQDNYLLIDATGQAMFMRDQRTHGQSVSGWPRGQVRAAVLDGMGGHGHGREAAEAVVAGLLAMPACASLDQLCDRLDALHARLQAEFDVFRAETGMRPGTTLTLLEIVGGTHALLYHVGDSRLYAIGPDRATPLTVDHVPATTLAMAGQLGESAWWRQVHGEHRPHISQAFILGNAFSDDFDLSDGLVGLAAPLLPPWLAHLPDRRALVLEPGHTYLLATDGFWSCVEANRWTARWPGIMASGASAQARLDGLFAAMEALDETGLHIDNLTAVAICPLPQDATALPS